MSDYRDNARDERWWADIRGSRALFLVDDPDLSDYDPDEEGIWVPFEWVVCDACGGEGKYVNPNIDRHGLTSEDFEDEDFRDMYTSGAYDVTCELCQGRNVIPRFTGDHKTGQLIEREIAERQAYAAEAEAERRMLYGVNY